LGLVDGSCGEHASCRRPFDLDSGGDRDEQSGD
jgi:hypothetical protein